MEKADGTAWNQPGAKPDDRSKRQRAAAAGSPAAAPTRERTVPCDDESTLTSDGELVEPGYGHGV
jgi:hypothetical protein